MQISLRRKGALVGIVAACAAAVALAAQPQPGQDHPTKAAGTKMADPEKLVGKKAPDFKLVDTEGNTHTLSEYTRQGKIVVLEWFNGECPWVVKHHHHARTMSDTYAAYKDKDVVWLAINSGHERDSSADLAKNKKFREDWKIEFPILFDPTGDTGRAYGSRNTPTMYVIDKEGVIVYAGAIDSDSHLRNLGETNYVKEALEAVLAGSTVAVPFARPYGCTVKYGRN